MGGRVRAQIGSALPDGQGAPGPELATEEDSMSNAIRELVWGGQSDPRDDDERLDALRNANVYA